MSDEAAEPAEETAPAPETGTALTGEPTNNPLTTWRDDLPDEVRNDPSLASFKDVEGLAKSYVHAQKMVGAEKVAVPHPDWTESDWAGHYDKLGRPSSHDDYKNPEETTLSGDSLKEFKELIYNSGLSDKQGEEVLKGFSKFNDEHSASREDAHRQSIDETKDALAAEYGRDAPYKLDVARSVIQKFGSPELMEVLETTGIGNNPDLIKMFVKVGDLIVEDDVRGGRSTLHLNSASNAASELDVLKSDSDFLTKLSDRTAIGHKEALERWNHLHQLAFQETA